MSLVEQSDCPICMDELPVVGGSNRVVTECGHVFHTSCLLTNVSHNGFGCPYCRASLAVSSVEVIDEESDESSSAYDPTDDLNDGMVMDVENVTHTDYVLRGLRWFFNRESGEELDDEDDVVPDEIDADSDPYGEDMFESNSQVVPPASYISGKLVRQGITMDDLVKVLMYRTSDREFGDDAEEEYERLSRSVHSRMVRIVSGYIDRPDELQLNANALIASEEAGAMLELD